MGRGRPEDLPLQPASRHIGRTCCLCSRHASVLQLLHVTSHRDFGAHVEHNPIRGTQTICSSCMWFKQRELAERSGKLACHAGPFAIVPGTPAPSAAGMVEAGTTAGAAESSTLVTHLAPHKARADLEHTIKFFPLALGLFEGQLGSSFPLPSYHQASHPCCLRCCNARAICSAKSSH